MNGGYSEQSVTGALTDIINKGPSERPAEDTSLLLQFYMGPSVPQTNKCHIWWWQQYALTNSEFNEFNIS